jgi:hypothetical protein
MMTDELERRVRTLEEELNGEKHLTRYAVDQTRRNGEVLHVAERCQRCDAAPPQEQAAARGQGS